MSKTPGSTVLSGSINGETALVIRAHAARGRFALCADHAGDAGIGTAAAANSPAGRSAWRTCTRRWRWRLPWRRGSISGEPIRFLAVLVVATPCPLLIAIPVAIIGSISLAARRGIIVRDPAVLEQIDTCRTVIFDKTGTLTYGEPRLVEQLVAPGFEAHEVLHAGGQLGAIFETSAGRGDSAGKRSANDWRRAKRRKFAKSPAKVCAARWRAASCKSPAATNWRQ